MATAEKVSVSEGTETIEVDLRNPWLALFLAWLIPGAGHLYQRRTGKGLLFMICIVGTFFFGMYLSDNRAVYYSRKPLKNLLVYMCQVGQGLPTLFAVVQSYRVNQNPAKLPLFAGYMAPPKDARELADWHEELHSYLELGIVYTMVAGLLNVLAMYDAFAGPLIMGIEEPEKPKDDEENDPKRK